MEDKMKNLILSIAYPPVSIEIKIDGWPLLIIMAFGVMVLIL
jgi:hypothetical protein